MNAQAHHIFGPVFLPKRSISSCNYCYFLRMHVSSNQNRACLCFVLTDGGPDPQRGSVINSMENLARLFNAALKDGGIISDNISAVKREQRFT